MGDIAGGIAQGVGALGHLAHQLALARDHVEEGLTKDVAVRGGPDVDREITLRQSPGALGEMIEIVAQGTERALHVREFVFGF